MNQYESLSESQDAELKQLTIRGFDEELERRLRSLARREGISLNKAALRLLRSGAGIEESGSTPNTIGDALDEFIGVWSNDQAHEFMASVQVFEQIDDEFFG